MRSIDLGGDRHYFFTHSRSARDTRRLLHVGLLIGNSDNGRGPACPKISNGVTVTPFGRAGRK